MPGNAPASPAPNRKRTAKSVAKLRTIPVNPVNTDHNTTTELRRTRGPKRSAIAPDGVWNRAYPRANDDITHPHWVSLN